MLIASTSFAQFGKSYPPADSKKPIFTNEDKLVTVLQMIKYSYVDSVNEEDVVEQAINDMLSNLDPHSVYIPTKKVKEMEEPLVGNFEGVGIQFNIMNDTILVVSPISGGPSEKLGIMAGDKIIMIDDTLVAGIGFTNRDVVDHLRGEKGTIVNVGIKREGEKELISFDIERDKIPLYSVDAVYMVDSTTGYIKINRFAAKTVQEFREGLTKLRKQGMQHLIMDLSNNGGGYLRAAIELSDVFLESQKLIVFTKGEHQSKSEVKATSRINDFEKGNLVVLIDEGSASASEIVSGAIQDWDRGIIVGRRSFGKGLVQKPYPLPDGSMIRFTIARYYTPTGRSIQKPYDKGTEAYYEDIYNRYENGELYNADSISFPDSLKFSTPKGRAVYGGGGIMPDYFVPVDTGWTSKTYSRIARKGLQNKFSLNYTNKHRKELLSNYPDIVTFKTKFQVDEAVISKFKKFLEKEKIEIDEQQYEKSKHVLHTQIKALVARNLWDSSAYFYIMNDINESFQKAHSILLDGTYNNIMN